ncbi:metal-dependent hydrolase [Sinorhizobium medicae]|nr:metal-dependent hydrolase [Sinorhizobium medicae]
MSAASTRRTSMNQTKTDLHSQNDSIRSGSALSLAGKRQYLIFVGIAFANVLLHLFLDSIAADIRWLYPFSDIRFNLVEIPARYQPWYLNFILHWTFAAEMAICVAAVWAWGSEKV